MDDPDIEAVKEFLTGLQDRICASLEAEDGKASFVRDEWSREDGGGGISRVLAEGAVFEKAGVNFSHVHGERLPPTASAARPELANRRFQAMGVSVVVHPLSPYVPTSHMNVRFFLAENDVDPPVWWFGGGFDLTPYYGFPDDAVNWHRRAKTICDRFGPDVYRRYKEECDNYFHLRHRDEARGVGGIFFDDLNEWGFERCFQFVREVGEGYLEAYSPIVSLRRDMNWGERERQFQLYRRGRYVEFNLVYDRGTLFGLQSGGRTESILVSMPPLARWEYGWQPAPGSPEEELYRLFLKPRDWIDFPGGKDF